MFHLSGRRALLVVVALALVTLAVWWLLPSNAPRVRARFYALATLASVPAAEQDLARLARARRFGATLTTDAEVTFDEGTPPLTGREALVLLVAQPAGLVGGLRVELTNVHVEIAPGGTTATTSARARLIFTDPQTKSLSAEDRDIRLDWRKIDGEWLMAVARIGAPISPPSVPPNGGDRLPN